MKCVGRPNLDSAVNISSGMIASNALAQSNASNTKRPSFSAKALSMKRLATKIASDTLAPLLKPNWECHNLESMLEDLSLFNKIKANSLYPALSNEIGM